MTSRPFGAVCLTAFVVGLALAVPAAAQDAGSSIWMVPRTTHGHPDLQGGWANNNAPPLQRPEVLGDREHLTDAELAGIQSRANELFALDAGDAAFGDTVFSAALAEVESFTSTDAGTGNYNQFWLVERDWDNRTSLIVNPPNGRLPARTAEAKLRADDRSERRRIHARWTNDRSLGERCLSFGAPRLGAGYNTYYQIFQTETHVALLMEMAHDARIIPIGRRPHVDDDVRQWLGDSRGYWDGDSLVVQTRNYSPKSSFMGAAENLKVTERFTRVAPDVLQYEVAVNDPSTWTEPWSAMIPLRRSPDAIFEYGCHEGNIGMEGILAGARALEKAEAETGAVSGPDAATDVTRAEIEAVRTAPEGGIDRQVKVVDIGKDTNVAIGILHRDAVARQDGPVRGIAHTKVTEVYYIVSGSGVLVTGGTMEDTQELPTDSEVVQVAVGPSVIGSTRNGHSRRVSEGDVVVIPAGVFHGWVEIDNHVTYVSIRPDPSQVLPAGYVNPAATR